MVCLRCGVFAGGDLIVICYCGFPLYGLVEPGSLAGLGLFGLL